MTQYWEIFLSLFCKNNLFWLQLEVNIIIYQSSVSTWLQDNNNVEMETGSRFYISAINRSMFYGSFFMEWSAQISVARGGDSVDSNNFRIKSTRQCNEWNHSTSFLLFIFLYLQLVLYHYLLSQSKSKSRVKSPKSKVKRTWSDSILLCHHHHHSHKLCSATKHPIEL